jgi:lambda repressor-like predicted transcriptional regulator
MQQPNALPQQEKPMEGMHPVYILAELKKRKITLGAIAAELDCSNNSVRLVIWNKQQSKRIAAHIAQLIGKTTEDLWPGQYKYVGRKPFKQTLRHVSDAA